MLHACVRLLARWSLRIRGDLLRFLMHLRPYILGVPVQILRK
jgi:hypothetical protein